MATARIPLSQGVFALVDDEDVERLRTRHWFASRRMKSYFYASSRVSGHRVLDMHRFIMDAQPGQIVDHINGDGLDNRRANLRICTHRQNMANRKRSKHASTPYKGVQRNGKRWVAVLVDGGKRYRLYGFKTPEAAAAAYDIIAVLRFGVFARLNFPHVFPECNQRSA